MGKKKGKEGRGLGVSPPDEGHGFGANPPAEKPRNSAAMKYADEPIDSEPLIKRVDETGDSGSSRMKIVPEDDDHQREQHLATGGPIHGPGDKEPLRHTLGAEDESKHGRAEQPGSKATITTRRGVKANVY